MLSTRTDADHWVYGLADPRTNEIHYVGVTVNVKARFFSHIYEGKAVADGRVKRGSRLRYTKTDKSLWIASVLNDGFVPALVLLEKTDGRGALMCEAKWVRKLLKTNRLTNNDARLIAAGLKG